MKKINFLLTLFLILGFSACSNDNPVLSTDDNEPSLRAGSSNFPLELEVLGIGGSNASTGYNLWLIPIFDTEYYGFEIKTNGQFMIFKINLINSLPGSNTIMSSDIGISFNNFDGVYPLISNRSGGGQVSFYTENRSYFGSITLKENVYNN